MPIQLRPGEMPLYPQPYVENEPNLLVITTQRVWHFGDRGQQEVETRDIAHVSRLSDHPRRPIAFVLGLMGLPLVIAGLYLFFTAGPLPSAVPSLTPPPPAAAPGDDPAGPAPDDPAVAAAGGGSADPFMQKLGGAAMVLFGGLFGAGAWLLFKKERHLVIVRGGTSVLQLKAGDKNEQTMILAVLQASSGGGKSAAAPAAPAPKKWKVDDKGDPVKALQDLQAQRQAGKVSQEEFEGKREILLERAKQRK